jgi:diguanylate cyclase
MGAPGPLVVEWQRQLGEARHLLEAGDIEPARQLASKVLTEADEYEVQAVQGHALMVLAQYDRVVGRFRRAIEAAQRAVQSFQLDGDILSEASALSLLAHSCSYLGRDEEAVEAGLLSVRLGNLLPPGPHQVNFYNYLGVAYLWAKSFGSAEAALREAERLASLYRTESNVLLPRINLAWLECVRLFEERYFTDALPGTDTLRQRLQQCSTLFEDGTPFPGLPGVRAILQRFGHCAWALLHCWEGNLDAAQQQLDEAEDQSKPGRDAAVANFIVHWVRAELCWSRHDLAAARDEAVALISHSGRAEFEQMAYMGHLLLTQILRKQGLHGRACEEERTHRRRELRVRADILENRFRVVEAQLEIRSSKRHLEMLSKHSKELERLSYEDALTGIANRRRLEQQLALSLAARLNPELPLCVALIDLDGFKQVNDTFSHAAGDEVLKGVAAAMRSAVRDSDLLARFGGDEFVAVFPNTDAQTAWQVCHRIRSQVEQLRWPQLSPDLRIGLSIGIAQAEQGDSPADVVQRSDAAMFKAKGHRPRAPPE